MVAYQGEAVLGGKETTFHQVFQQGKPVVLNFWAGLCPPCQAEMPAFQRAYDAQQGKIIILGLDVGPFLHLGSYFDAIALYNRLEIQYPLAFAETATPLRLYSVQGMPTTVFFDARGQVVDKVTGALDEQQLQAHVRKLATAPG